MKGADTLDELTCTTIHGFCQKLIAPYPVEAGQDPRRNHPGSRRGGDRFRGTLWTHGSQRGFGRDPRRDGLGRTPTCNARSSPDGEDLFAALMLKSPDQTLKLIRDTAHFLKDHRTARGRRFKTSTGHEAHGRVRQRRPRFRQVVSRVRHRRAPTTAAIVDDLLDVAECAGRTGFRNHVSGERLTRSAASSTACGMQEERDRIQTVAGPWEME